MSSKSDDGTNAPHLLASRLWRFFKNLLEHPQTSRSMGGSTSRVALGQNGHLGISKDGFQKQTALHPFDAGETATLWANLPIGLAIVHADGRLIAFNNRFHEMSGYSSQELKSFENFSQLFDDPVEGAWVIAQANKKGFLGCREVRLRRRDDASYVASLSLQPLRKEARYWQAIVEDISEQKRTEHTLRATEESYKALYDDNPSMYFTVDVKGIVLSVNKFGAEELGYKVEELMGKPVFGVFVEADRKAVQQQLATCLQHPQQVFRWELQKIRKDGSRLWVKEVARAVYSDGRQPIVLIVCEDITDRKQVEQALREGEERYRGLVESFPYVIFVEQDGSLVYTNSAGLRLMKCRSFASLHGLGLRSLFAKNPENPFEKFLRVEPQGVTSPVMECKVDRMSGELVDVEVAFVKTIYQGRPAIQAIARDISETKTLRQTAQKMERLAALGEISATIAHEIRNPLASICLNLQYLSTHLQIPQTSRRIFEKIQQGVTIIQNIVSGILDFARLAPPSFKTTNINKVLENSLTYVKQDLEQAGVHVRKDFSAVQPNVLIDPNQMVQVFVNLLSNAKDAMEGGGQLTIQTSSDDRNVEIRIEDTGKGIAQHNLSKIFNPFFTTKANGIGLGLAIVLRILEQHHAEIQVESEAGAGTRCIVKLSFTPEFEPA
jgi:PAS domain S-box-containing protein